MVYSRSLQKFWQMGHLVSTFYTPNCQYGFSNTGAQFTNLAYFSIKEGFKKLNFPVSIHNMGYVLEELVYSATNKISFYFYRIKFRL